MIGLDWISLFHVVIPNLYAEPSIDEEVKMVSDSTPVSSDSLRTQNCDLLSFRARTDWHNPNVAECVQVCSVQLSDQLSVGD